MLSTTIYNKIFNSDSVSQDIAAAYARSGQQDVALEWVGRQSMRIAELLAYLRVNQSAESACLFLNNELSCYLEALSPNNHFPDVDEDMLTNESMVALNFIMQTDASAVDNLCAALCQEILTGPVAPDAAMLKPLNTF